jgi:predicted nuclease with TOPRIM domain
MTVSIDQDLKEILNKLDQKIDNIQKDITELKIGQTRLEAELKGEMKALDGKLSGEIKALDGKLSGEIKALDGTVGGLAKRVENSEFTARGIVIGLLIVILGGAAKLFGFIPQT